jgi:uracil-DNA glycosylase
MVIGQAPSISDLRNGRMYTGPAGRKLIGWLFDAGFTEDDLGTTVYLTALTLCFPGRLPGKSTDRAPSARERANCRRWLDGQVAAVRPKVIIPFGKMAIDTYLPKASLDDTIGKVFAWMYRINRKGRGGVLSTDYADVRKEMGSLDYLFPEICVITVICG